MKHVTFDDHQYITLIPYQNNINFDFIDAIRKRNLLQNKWKFFIKKVLYQHCKAKHVQTCIKKNFHKKCKISQIFRFQIACDAY